MADALSHDRAVELLPWLVNGTLAPDERDAVSEHSRNCVICRRELEDLDALAQRAAREVAVDAGLQAPPDMRRINARIDALRERERRGTALLDALRHWSADRWRLAFAVQTLVLAAVVIAWLMPVEPDAEFTTLTAPPGAVLPADRDYLRVVFDPGLDAAAIAAMLSEQGLAVAAGPSARGVYTLEFAPAREAAARQGVLANLQADERVLFAQPVAGSNVQQVAP